MPALTAIAGLIFGAALAFRRRRRMPARSLIISPSRSTLIAEDGAVRSVQTARLTLSKADLDRLWKPVNLENLAKTYWRFLSKVTLGLIGVSYTERDRAVMFLRWLTLLRLDAPEYVLEPLHGRVIWTIKDGLLVARSGRGCGFLSLDVRRDEPAIEPGEEAHLTIEVEVANFYPSIASGLSTLAYEATQAVVHVLVTHAFLRSLARLELAESEVRRFGVEPAAGDQSSARR